MTNEPIYSQDWMSNNIPVWQEMLKEFEKVDEWFFLEIGCFEGRTTRWMLDTYPNVCVAVIDTFEGGADQKDLDTSNLREKFMHNIHPHSSRVKVFQYRSDQILREMADDGSECEFIYVDGSHEYADVLNDARLSFEICAHGGLICFDDYGWEVDPVVENRPKRAIDEFLASHAQELEVLHKQYQVWVRKR